MSPRRHCNMSANRGAHPCRHSRVGGNPAKNKGLRSRQLLGFVPLRGDFLNHLDSRLRGNDGVWEERTA
jgi:hypothetical protein